MAIPPKSHWALRNVLAADDEPALLAALVAERISPLLLPGAGVTDTTGLLARAHHDLPHPPGRDVPTSWTALAYNLWEHIALSPATELAVVWRDSDHLLRANLADFLAAVDAVQHLARQLTSPTNPAATRKTLYLFLLGRG